MDSRRRLAGIHRTAIASFLLNNNNQTSLEAGHEGAVQLERRLSQRQNVLSTVVTDQTTGRPCQNMQCTAFKWDGAQRDWIQMGDTVLTNAQGRIPVVHPGVSLSRGLFKLRFAIKEYYSRHQLNAFFPYIDIVIEVTDPSEHCHVPVLISQFGYTVYRG